jgi:DNA-binding response OmpR family regulator
MASKRILLVDNRPEHFGQPVLRLQLAGYEVDQADGGDAGLAKLRQRRYDLLILDAELPAEDGWGVLKDVRGDESLKDLKVIVFMAGQGETGQLLLVPVEAELRRPFTIGALLDTVKKVIGNP